LYFSLFFIVIIAYLIVERIRHEQRLKRIRIRIHVNGTRGKSSVTRLIAAALRRSGIRTLAKTTGTAPQLILPDGNRETVRRRGPANILEQLGVIRRADSLGVDAIVIECMALDPTLQFVSETKLIRSTIGVITNVRPDHFEVMGEDLDCVAVALSKSIPLNGTLVTADVRYFPLFTSLASALHTHSILADAEEACLPEALQEHLIFSENVAIARQVCSLLGLDPAVVNSSLADECSALEKSIVSKCFFGGKTIYFINAFAANDIDSTRIIQEWASARTHCPKPWVALFNNRDDRPLRMRSFARFLGKASSYDYVAVIGEALGLVTRYFRRSLHGETLLPLGGTSPELLITALLEHLPDPELTIIGMGNEKGAGQFVARFFRGE
jgi:poly-gamma-glutamate synthase PgsB/CapB